jgi:hypothetical protein
VSFPDANLSCRRKVTSAVHRPNMIIQYTVQKPKQSQGIIHIKLEVYNRKSSTNVVLVTEISITNICIWNLYCDDKPQKWQIKKIYMERKEKEKEKKQI